MKPACRSLLALLATGTLLAGCASTGPVESRPSPPLPPAQTPPAQAPAQPPIQPPPLPRLPDIGEPIPPSVPPATVPVPPPRPVVVPFPSEREGRALVISYLPAYVKDKEGWATDLFAAFAALRIQPTPDNLCAAIAIIEQESTFQADPEVAGLSKIVWKEIERRRERLHLPRLLVDTALLKTSPDGRSYKARIDALRTEKQMNALFDDMISELPAGRSLLEGYNPVHTGGPMQVSVAFAEEQVKEKPYPYPRRGSVRNEVFSRRGGLYFGVAILLDYPAPYSQLIYRFADFNAGRYSSRNAAFQDAVARLANRPLALDGDLLRYVDGRPSSEPSATLLALQGLSAILGLSRAEMQRDLALEKTARFGATPLYAKVFALAESRSGSRLPRETMPRIDLKSPKIQRSLTTAWFAERVDARHRTCLGRNRATSP